MAVVVTGNLLGNWSLERRKPVMYMAPSWPCRDAKSITSDYGMRFIIPPPPLPLLGETVSVMYAAGT